MKKNLLFVFLGIAIAFAMIGGLLSFAASAAADDVRLVPNSDIVINLLEIPRSAEIATNSAQPTTQATLDTTEISATVLETTTATLQNPALDGGLAPNAEHDSEDVTSHEQDADDAIRERDDVYVEALRNIENTVAGALTATPRARPTRRPRRPVATRTPAAPVAIASPLPPDEPRVTATIGGVPPGATAAPDTRAPAPQATATTGQNPPTQPQPTSVVATLAPPPAFNPTSPPVSTPPPAKPQPTSPPPATAVPAKPAPRPTSDDNKHPPEVHPTEAPEIHPTERPEPTEVHGNDDKTGTPHP
jgi:hypothetical protein